MVNEKSLKDFLLEKADAYNQPFFIESDPVCIPHLFSKKADREIAGFFAAIFAWGNRTTIINKTRELMRLMDDAPHHFCLHHTATDLKNLMHFQHRTFNTTDLLYFMSFFQHHYRNHESLEAAFLKNHSLTNQNTEQALNGFFEYFFSLPDAPARTKKHIAAPAKNSACKRLNMFLRWMVRKDDRGVDLGLWQTLRPAQLVIPLDLHVSRVARKFRLLERTATDWKAAVELTNKMKMICPDDPVRMDYALFGLGVLEKF